MSDVVGSARMGADAGRRRVLRLLLALPAAGGLMALGGCAGGVLRPITPQVSLADLQLLESSLLEARFRARLRVTNPNNVELAFRGLQLGLDINGLALAQGATGQSIRLPRLGEEFVDVDFSVNAINALRQVLAWSDRGDRLDYALNGTLFTSGNRGLRFSESGSLSPSNRSF